MVLEKLGKCMKKREHLLFPHITCKSNLRWIIDLNIKVKTIKIPEENMGEYFCDLGVENIS